MTTVSLVVSFCLVLFTNVWKVLFVFVLSTYFCLCFSLGIVPSLTIYLIFGGGCIVTNFPLGEPARRFFYDDAG